ncbi:MAG: hypothetical protein IJ736_06525 [Firmicutes bacterium]|nr:hypothetical protein [Bacillota bacterium]
MAAVAFAPKCTQNYKKGAKSRCSLNGINFSSAIDPYSGSGRMILSFAEVMHDEGYNHQKNLFVVAQDVDLNCVCMTYIQLSLYGIPAIVIRGSVFDCDGLSYWYTPAYFYDFWYKKEIFKSDISEEMRSRKISSDVQISFEELFGR